MTKNCFTCKEPKPLSDFPVHTRSKDGRRGQCTACRVIYEREWRAKNIESARAAGRRYSQKNLQQRREANREARTAFTPELFSKTIEAQEYACAICAVDLRTMESKHIHADHDHYTGKPRGILCKPCNVGLGFYNDSIVLLEKAIEYLKRTKP